MEFSANNGNLVVYLTTPAAEAPRVKGRVVDDLLEGLIDAAARPPVRRGEDVSEASFDAGRLLSTDARWLRLIGLEARRAFSSKRSLPEQELHPGVLAHLLAPLRRLFSQFRLYGMLLVRDEHAQTDIARMLSRSAWRLALSQEALVLFPHGGEVTESLDTLPAFDLAVSSKESWPGLLFWTRRGSAAAFVAGRGAEEAVDSISRTLTEGTDADLDRVVKGYGSPRKRTILHLSDLHFGTEHAAENAEYVEAELADVAKEASRVVITGDLIETPSDDSAARFRSFANLLHRSSGKPVIVVPGNHDQRWHGNQLAGIGQDLKQVAQLSWQSHVIDDDMETIFMCFNSCIEGNLARGRTGKKQRTQMAGVHRTAIGVDARRRDYLRVALVHHHPFSFASASTTTWFQWLLAAMHIEEPALKMADADAFLEWCAQWQISAVLHGHKHIPRYETRRVEPGHPYQSHELTAIGCGSTLGAEGSPLGYCQLDWDPKTSKWSTLFFESRGGGPFVPSHVSVTRAQQPGFVEPIHQGRKSR